VRCSSHSRVTGPARPLCWALEDSLGPADSPETARDTATNAAYDAAGHPLEWGEPVRPPAEREGHGDARAAEGEHPVQAAEAGSCREPISRGIAGFAAFSGWTHAALMGPLAQCEQCEPEVIGEHRCEARDVLNHVPTW
jgi:hypothetical protein